MACILLPQQRSGGFTLTETLLILVILVVLVFIILPVVGTIRRSGDQVKSVSNLRQIGIATLAYAVEHNGKIPHNMRGGDIGNTTLGPSVQPESPPRRLFDRDSWVFGTGNHNYLDTPDVLYSPFAMEYKTRKKNTLFQKGSNSNALYIGYYFYFIPRADEKRPKPPVHPDIFNDRLIENPRAPLYSDLFYYDEDYPEKFPSDTMNVLFLDGSVRSFDYETITALRGWGKTFEYWKTH